MDHFVIYIFYYTFKKLKKKYQNYQLILYNTRITWERTSVSQSLKAEHTKVHWLGI